MINYLLIIIIFIYFKGGILFCKGVHRFAPTMFGFLLIEACEARRL
ncbi:hypothetical protein NEIMUCOT_06270 [Neisseria mucosa ATCC 25996]|uniref:Uncharacterized protein n=1 Tax=Neisseria mucosa (strain ATCC 25996 / DSM 4631 / NCTC 10774 / M26) TaxID=546266 RepID=D3A035_NEIM2|nr:hypothetical protein NEIMUCOT_06270 [Neisseria mucosa ATCC 25996]